MEKNTKNVEGQNGSNAQEPPVTAASFHYDDVFPALPDAVAPMPSSSNGPHKVTTPVNQKNTRMRVGVSDVTQVFCVPAEERKADNSDKFGEGETMRTCAQISKETHAIIETFTSKDKSITFLITGKINNVLNARRKVLTNFQTQASATISIPKEHHRWILGKSGTRLKELEKSTTTKISMPGINEVSNKITVTGTKDNIEKALHEIKIISDERSKKAFERVSIEKIYHPFIAGAHNSKINSLSESTGTRINIPPQSVDNDEITIAGEKEGVVEARDTILELYERMKKDCVTLGVEVPKAQHKYVIGPKGSTVNEILEETSVSVEVPPYDSASQTITLRGTQKNIQDALKRIFEITNSMQGSKIDAPGWIHRYIIGRKGASIREIQQGYEQCHVEFSGDKIKIEGPPDQLAVVKERLADKVNYYLANFGYAELVVNKKHFKHIIGKNGVNVNRLKTDKDLNINMSESDSLIRIEGPKERVIQVKQELEEMVYKLENEKERDVIVDHKLHRTIIGTKGEKVKELQESFNVIITFPSPTENSDIVKVRGPKDKVDKCCVHISKLVKSMAESSYTLTIPLKKEYHKLIIGKGGSKIKKIREETNTKIDLSADNDPKEVIKITGKRESVEEANNRIQKILKDMVEIRGPLSDVEKAKQKLTDLTDEQSSKGAEISITLRAKADQHKFLIGKKGAKIKKIRESTGARIIFPNENDADKEQIVILGKKSSVEQAKKELEDMIKEIESNVEDSIEIDPCYHKHFVTRKGEVLLNIIQNCGGSDQLNISFPRYERKNNIVQMKGHKDAIEKAKQEMLKVVEELKNQVTIEVVIPNKDHRSILRRRGSVDEIRSKYNVRIQFPERLPDSYHANGNCNGETTNGVSSADIVNIVGKEEDCALAKEELLSLVPVTLELKVPYEYHGFIIGQHGNAIKDISANCNVNVDVPHSDARSDIIKIKGKPTAVEEAKELILNRIKEVEAEREERELRSYEIKLEVHPDHHPQLIGRKGEIINKIRKDHDVIISFPKKEDPASDHNLITITGYQDKVEAAKKEIMNIVRRLEGRHKEEVQIDSRVHSRMIGAKGKNVRKIMEEYNVEIKFPRTTDSDPNVVTILGDNENIQDCKEHLLTLEEEFMVDVKEEYRPTNEPPPVKEEERSEVGFVVKGAPWDQKKMPDTNSTAEFPSFGARVDDASSGAKNSQPAWGPRR